MGHSHSHTHSHPHDINKIFLLGISFNIFFIIVEIFYGMRANSVALIADATHNAGDVLGLLVAWFGYWIAHKKAPEKFTYGFKNATVIAAFVNSIVLFMAIGGIAWEAIERLGQHESVTSSTVIFVAGIGIVLNGLTAYLFSRDRHHDINIKGAFLHMMFDAAISAGVLLAGILIFFKSWLWIDPVVSLIIVLVILVSSWKLLKESLGLMLLAAPASINLPKLKCLLEEHPGLIAYHDLHIWPLSTTEVSLSAHLIVTQDSFSNDFYKAIEEKIKAGFPISHVTFQLELQGHEKTCTTNCL